MASMDQPDDVVFDAAHGEYLAGDVYGTTRGALRLRLLWDDMLATVPRLTGGGLRVIDVGAGMAQIAARVAALGHDVTACEPSGDMLERARASLRDHTASARIQFVQARAQDLDRDALGAFDLVICHAVLEWVADPKDVLRHILGLLAPDGQLSLLFYNRNAAILKRALRGDLSADALGERDPTDGWPRPLDPPAVHAWLDELGVLVQARAGIRIFHDHLPESMRTAERLDDLAALEWRFRHREPFASLAQHIHLVALHTT